MEKLTINKGFDPKLKIPIGENPPLRRKVKMLGLESGMRSTPCKSLDGMSTAYWHTEANEDKEAGVILIARINHRKEFFIGVYNEFDGVDLQTEASSIAEYSAPSIIVAVEGLAAFLYPYGNQKY